MWLTTVTNIKHKVSTIIFFWNFLLIGKLESKQGET